MNRPDALEALLGAGNTQEAFARILLETLRDLKESVQGLDRKFDEHSAQQSAKDTQQDAALAHHEADITDLTRRVTSIEEGHKSGREQLWKVLGVAISVVSLIITVANSLHAHH